VTISASYTTPGDTISFLFNANCPVCNFQIQHYVQYPDRNGLPIRFDDLNSDAPLRWGLDADTAAKLRLTAASKREAENLRRGQIG
jgi:hypothetical protein